MQKEFLHDWRVQRCSAALLLRLEGEIISPTILFKGCDVQGDKSQETSGADFWKRKEATGTELKSNLPSAENFLSNNMIVPAPNPGEGNKVHFHNAPCFTLCISSGMILRATSPNVTYALATHDTRGRQMPPQSLGRLAWFLLAYPISLQHSQENIRNVVGFV